MRILIAHFTTHWVNTVGGVEKVVCNFANEMIKSGHEVIILYIDEKEGQPYFHLDSTIKTYNILFKQGKKIISEKLPLKLRVYRELFRPFSLKKVQSINASYKGKLYGNQIKEYITQCQPDVVVACSGQSIKYVIEDAGCSVPVVGMIHSDCYQSIPHLSKEELQAMGKCKVIQVLFPSYIVPCQEYIKGTHFVAIGNTVERASTVAMPGDGKSLYKIICVGSINGNKNQKLLADAFELIANEYPNWNVEFWGDYHSAKGITIKKYIENKHITQMKIMGTTKNIAEVYAGADIFCLPSYVEGFPLALTEAMAAGLPSIGLKSCNAVSQLIDHDKNGYLVENTPCALVEALIHLMNSAELRYRMGENAKMAMENFSPSIIWENWEHLLKSARQ